jgi:MFS family permease
MTTYADPGPPVRRFLRSHFGGLPGSFWLLWTGTLVNRLGMMVQPFLAVYLHAVLGMGLGATGVQMAVFGAGQACSQIIGGWMTDRVGRQPTMVASLLASAAFMLVVGAAEGPPVLTVGIFLLGLAMDAYRPAATAAVADAIAPADRVRAYGLLFWAINLGFSGAMVLGGALQRLGAQWLFWTNSVCTAAFAGLLVLGRVGRSRPPAPTATPQDRPAGGFPVLLRDRVMVVFCLMALVYGVVYVQAFSTLPIVMVDDGLGAAAYGVAVAMNGIVVVLVQPLLGPVFSRRDHNAVFCVGLLLLGMGFGLLGLAHHLGIYVVAVVIWAVGEIAVVSVGQAIVIDLAPPELRGRYIGVYGAAWGGAAGVLGPAAGTWLLGFGAGVLWASCAVACAAAAVAQWTMGGQVRRRAAVDITG